MEMLINGEPKWTHITADGRKAIILTDQGESYVCPIMVLVQSKIDSNKFEFQAYTSTLEKLTVANQNLNLRPYDPFEGVQVDCPIWVKTNGSNWHKQHFAYVSEGFVRTWEDGKTSFTTNQTSSWPIYSFTDPTEKNG